MRKYKTTEKQRKAIKRLYWEKIYLTRTQRETLSLTERKRLTAEWYKKYHNQEI